MWFDLTISLIVIIQDLILIKIQQITLI